MATRYYVIPENRKTPDERDVKYLSTDAAFAGLQWAAMDYGVEPVFFVGAFDISAAQHQTLTGHNGVQAIPPGAVTNTNLDAAVGSALAPVQTALERLMIPADWVTTSTTWRAVLAACLRMSQFMQRLHGLYNANLSGRTARLDIRMSNLPADFQQALLSTVNSFGWDAQVVAPDWTMRRFLAWAGAQFTAPILFAGEVW